MEFFIVFFFWKFCTSIFHFVKYFFVYYLLNCVLCVTADEATTCFSTVAAAFATDVTRAVLIFPQRFSSLELFHPFFHRQYDKCVLWCLRFYGLWNEAHAYVCFRLNVCDCVDWIQQLLCAFIMTKKRQTRPSFDKATKQISTYVPTAVSLCMLDGEWELRWMCGCERIFAFFLLWWSL